MNGDEIQKFSFDINWRKGDIGIRGKYSLDDEHQSLPEIVAFQRDKDGKEYCYTLAFFERTSEGNDIRTVGSRLFDAMNDYHIEYNDFITAVRHFTSVFDSLLYLEKVVKGQY